MDEQFAELKAACERYKDAPRGNSVGALDWTALLVILPAVLNMFVKDAALRDIISKIVALLSGLFAAKGAE